MSLKSLTVAALVSLSLAVVPSAAAQAAAPFSFVALGDMPYTLPGDYDRFERLIGSVNAMQPAFTLHVGDIKSGSTECSDANFQKVLDEFGMFDGSLIYTIGDNEWTDCHREKAGKFDPLERLTKVRQLFFKDANSLGKTKLPLTRQAASGPMVENARWVQGGVVFATIHVVGSNNGFERTVESAKEFFERDKANTEWIKATFDQATASNAPAVVFGFQADMFSTPAGQSGSGFTATLAALSGGAAAYGKPVLLIQGDSHVLVIDQPLKDKDAKVLPNVTRLQVMGENIVNAVQVMVDPASPAVFGFKPMLGPDSAGK